MYIKKKKIGSNREKVLKKWETSGGDFFWRNRDGCSEQYNLTSLLLSHLLQCQFLVGLSQVLAHGVDDVLVSLGHYGHFLVSVLQCRNLSAVG